ncbi:MAG: acyl-CoA dehydrogenase family protein [Woeseiaceae bacterium]
MLASTRDHVRSREQFGAPLIRIPAVAAALATFRKQLLLAETAVARTLDTVRGRDASPDLEAAAVARVIAGASATEAARIAHQLHGALGITREAGLHRLTTRLWAWQDAITSQRMCARHLGEMALACGEEEVWSRLTGNAVPPTRSLTH